MSETNGKRAGIMKLLSLSLVNNKKAQLMKGCLKSLFSIEQPTIEAHVLNDTDMLAKPGDPKAKKKTKRASFAIELIEDDNEDDEDGEKMQDLSLFKWPDSSVRLPVTVTNVGYVWGHIAQFLSDRSSSTRKLAKELVELLATQFKEEWIKGIPDSEIIFASPVNTTRSCQEPSSIDTPISFQACSPKLISQMSCDAAQSGSLFPDGCVRALTQWIKNELSEPKLNVTLMEEVLSFVSQRKPARLTRANTSRLRFPLRAKLVNPTARLGSIAVDISSHPVDESIAEEEPEVGWSRASRR